MQVQQAVQAQILQGDAIEMLRTLDDESVQCVVTSPPYYGLRDYGTAEWDGGADDCSHTQPRSTAKSTLGMAKGAASHDSAMRREAECPKPYRDECGKCGATRIDRQIGLESTLAEYIDKMVAVFREVRRVLRSDGVCWLNMGDSYAGSWGAQSRGNPAPGAFLRANESELSRRQIEAHPKWEKGTGSLSRTPGVKAKDLLGMPWRLAFALQADGWVLRQEIIWEKPNPMPESVTDRCTKAHESIFLLAKAKWSGPSNGRFAHITDEDARWLALCIDTEGCIVVKRVRQNDGGADAFGPQVSFGGTNRALVERFRDIVGHGNIAERRGKNAPMLYWQLGNNLARDFLHRIYPFLIVKQRQARIGIYVDDLVYYRGGKLPSRKNRTTVENEQLLSLWARSKLCNQFGNPDLSDVPAPVYGRWSDCERYFYDAVAIAEPFADARMGNPGKYEPHYQIGSARNDGNQIGANGAWDGSDKAGRNKRSVWTITTEPYPDAHFAAFPTELPRICILAGSRIGDTILDPFAGSGTTLQVALELSRAAIGIELNEEYVALANRRLNSTTLGLPLEIAA